MNRKSNSNLESSDDFVEYPPTPVKKCQKAAKFVNKTNSRQTLAKAPSPNPKGQSKSGNQKFQSTPIKDSKMEEICSSEDSETDDEAINVSLLLPPCEERPLPAVFNFTPYVSFSMKPENSIPFREWASSDIDKYCNK